MLCHERKSKTCHGLCSCTAQSPPTQFKHTQPGHTMPHTHSKGARSKGPGTQNSFRDTKKVFSYGSHFLRWDERVRRENDDGKDKRVGRFRMMCAVNCRQIHLTREFFSNTFTLCTHHIVAQGVFCAQSLHLHVIHDVTCLSVRYLFSVLLINFYNVGTAED